MVTALLGRIVLLALIAIRRLVFHGVVAKTKTSSRKRVVKTAGLDAARMVKLQHKVRISLGVHCRADVTSSGHTPSTVMQKRINVDASLEWEGINAIGANLDFGDSQKYLLDLKDVYHAVVPYLVP